MWLDNDWKLVQNVTYQSGESASQNPYELYNVIGDPKEEQNVIDPYLDIAGRLRKDGRPIEAWRPLLPRALSAR